MTIADRISGIVLLLFSALVLQQARALPYSTGSGPGPGFLPFWLGVLLGCLSIAVIARPGPGRTHVGGPAGPVAVVVALTACAAALSLLVGLVVSSAIFTGATLAYLRPRHPRANLAAAIITPVVVWLVFVRWLGVMLPAGPFGF